ncbi:MAG: hypothetical protein H6716_15170 [Polyangiaceae bacterium]|nr:hypothetical protein [Polyangiaceae bacterium]
MSDPGSDQASLVEAARKRSAAPRCPTHPGPLVESYFAKLNSPDGERALWLKLTAARRPGAETTLAEAWAVAFRRGHPPRATKQAWQLREPELRQAFRRGSQIQLGQCELSEVGLRGALPLGDSGSLALSWELRFAAGELNEPLFPLPAALYGDALPTGKLVSHQPDLRFNGEYEVAGERVVVSGWRGMLGHNWSRRHTPTYAWFHCNQFRREEDGASLDCVLEAVSAPLLAGRRVGSAVLRFKGLSIPFGFLDWQRKVEARSPSSWVFSARRSGAALRVEVQALESETAGLRYDNPTGGGVDCLNSKLAKVRMVLERPNADALCLVSDSGALEHGHVGAHPVRMLL